MVDDLEENRHLLLRRLRREGYDVSSADDGASTIEAVESSSFDLILLDVMMPGLSGIEVVTILRQKWGPAELPIIMVTAVDAIEGVVEALDLGANDYVTKPFEYAVLRARVRSQLRLKRYNDLKDQFVRIASHDLRNPLTNITSAVDLVLETSQLDAQTRDLLELSMRGCDDMARIIRDFLDFHALKDGAVALESSQFDLATEIEDVVAQHRNGTKAKRIELSLDLERPLQVRGDRARLRQVTANLLSNLLKFSPPGSAGCVRANRCEGGVLVEMIDEGPGFTPDDLSKIFKRYGRASGRPTGGEQSTGLGLSICREIVELHRGETGARNNESGKGATVWFRIPATAPSPEEA